MHMCREVIILKRAHQLACIMLKLMSLPRGKTKFQSQALMKIQAFMSTLYWNNQIRYIALTNFNNNNMHWFLNNNVVSTIDH